MPRMVSCFAGRTLQSPITRLTSVIRHVALLAIFAVLSPQWVCIVQAQEILDTNENSRPTRQIVKRSVQLKTVDGVTFDAYLGFLHVPENRSNPDSRMIKVAFMQVLSPAEGEKTPVFQFHGGPSDNAYLFKRVPIEVMENLEATDPVLIHFPFRSRAFREYLDFTDVVLMDDRGMGHSRPRLTCSESPKSRDYLQPADIQRQVISSFIERCAAEHTAAGADLAGYSLVEITDDFEDLRRALGYGKVVLQGLSFGSQTAFSVMRTYPESIERAYLAGLEGLEDTYDIPSETQQSLAQFISYANADPAVRRQLPKGDMGHALKTIFARLEKKPQTVKVKNGGEEVSIVLDHRTVAQIMQSVGVLRYRGDAGVGSAGSAEALPIILALYYKAYKGLAHIMAADMEHTDEEAVLNAAALAIDCASGMTPLRRVQIETDGAASAERIMFTPWGPEGLIRGEPNYFCQALGVPDLGDAWRVDMPSSIPVLFVHGDIDGSTPPGNAKRLIKKFENGKLIWARGAAHYLAEIEHLSPELVAWRTEFVRSGALSDDLPEEIILPPIAFETLPRPAIWAFKLGLGNLLLKTVGG